MDVPTPEFITKADLNVHEIQLLKCARAGEYCRLYSTEDAEARSETLRAREQNKPKHERLSDATLDNLAIREQAAAPAAPAIRAELIRFLTLGGNPDHPVHPKGVRLMGARIVGDLDCEFATLSRPLWLIACTFEKPPRFLRTRAEVIALSGCRVPGRLGMQRLRTETDLYLRHGFEAAGTVDLTEAQIGGQLSCVGGRFRGEMDALIAHSLTTEGPVFLANGFDAAGTVALTGARIGGQLDCSGGRFRGEEVALRLQKAEVKGVFWWRDVTLGRGELDLSAARMEFLVDDETSWPRIGKLKLDGCHYQGFGPSPTSYAARREWLLRQPEAHLTHEFRPQPFEHLANVLREMGHTEDAKRIAILKQTVARDAIWPLTYPDLARWKAIRRTAIGDQVSKADRNIRDHRKQQLKEPFKLLWATIRWSLSMVFGLVGGFGYRPTRALLLAIIFIAVGTWRFDAAHEAGTMVPNNPFLLKTEWDAALKGKIVTWRDGTLQAEDGDCQNPYECFALSVPDFQPFDPFIYSVDTFVPFVNLHQETHWIPQPEGKSGTWQWVRTYLWIHIIAGWGITALFVASIGVLVKKDV